MDMKIYTCNCLSAIRQKAPLVQNITNFVVMNSSANILLAIGASPVMAHARGEVEDMASLSSAVVLNIGTLDDLWVESMILSGKSANRKGIPVVLDPVGAGATRLRTEAARRIMGECRVDVIRGNASEVLSLWDSEVSTKGVESSVSLSDTVADSAVRIAKENNLVVAISGVEDCITDGTHTYRVKNGHPLMTKVTGLGCGLSAVTAAFCAVKPDELLKAVTAAFGFYGICGEIAGQTTGKPGSFFMEFLDALYSTGENEIMSSIQIDDPF
jgi:hydroxyethylthiazole kinase